MPRSTSALAASAGAGAVPRGRPGRGGPARPRCRTGVLPRRQQPALRHHAARRKPPALRVPRRWPCRRRPRPVARPPGRHRAGARWPGPFIGNLETPSGRTWRDAWTDLARRAGRTVALDAWVVQRDSQDPAEYAELWAGDAGAQPGSEAHWQLYAAWLRDFAATRRGEDLGFGVVTLQRPAVDRVDLALPRRGPRSGRGTHGPHRRRRHARTFHQE